MDIITGPSDTELGALTQHQLGRDFAQLSQRVRKRPLVLFFGRGSFSDNSKYLYLQAVSEPRGFEVMWCTFSNELHAALKSRGLPSVHLGQDHDKTIDLLLHAAVAVFCVNPNESLQGSVAFTGCLAGAQKIQLWHGVSVKRLTLQLIPHIGVRSVDVRQPWVASTAADHVLSTASCFDAYWREVFGCRSLLRAGYPRNAVMLREPSQHEMLGAELSERARKALASGKPAILVVPTWQRGKWTALTNSTFLAHAVKFARDHQANIFFKVHPTYFGHWNQADKGVEGLHLIDPGVDLYPWLSRFQALVTDYSSIMFDYLLTGNPVLTLDLKPGDHQDYEPDYSLVPAGHFREVFTMENFPETLKRALFDDTRREERLAYAQTLFEGDTLQAAEQLMHFIGELVERSQRPDFSVWQAPGTRRPSGVAAARAA